MRAVPVLLIVVLLSCNFSTLLGKEEFRNRGPVAVLDSREVELYQTPEEAYNSITDAIRTGFEKGKTLLDNIKSNEYVKVAKEASKWFMPLAQSIFFFGKAIMGFKEKESEELKFIKEQFKLVNLKMDTMEQEFGEIKKMIDWNTIKISFGEYERDIDSLQNMLVSMTDAPPEVIPMFRDHFIMLFERTFNDATTKLYEGIINQQSIYTDNLATAIRKFSSDHRRKVQKFLLGVLQLTLKGLEVEVMYMTFRNYNNATVEYWYKDWERRLDQIGALYQNVDNEILGRWQDQLKTDMEDFNARKHALGNQEYSSELYHFLADKFDHRVWMVMVYNPISGWNEHAISHCAGHVQFRARNHNIVVASAAADQPKRFNQAEAQRALDSVPRLYPSPTRDLARDLLNEIQKVAPVDCSRYSMAASIKWGGGLWYISHSDRRAYREWTHLHHGSIKSNLLVFG